jgi:hypothetical protein
MNKTILQFKTLALTVIISTNILTAQTTEFKSRVYVWVKPSNTSMKSLSSEKQFAPVLIMEVKEKKKADTLKALDNSLLTIKREKTFASTTYENEKEIKVTAKDSLIIGAKTYTDGEEVKVEGEQIGIYKANISVSKDSLMINFWLPSDYYTDENVRKSKAFHPDKTYYIKLKNRQAKSFYYANIELSAVTIPFKFHPGFKKGEIDVAPDFATGINVSTFLGYRLGKTTYMYDKYKGMLNTKYSASLGGFVSINSVKLDSSSTAIDLKPLKKETNAPTLSLGGGLVFDIQDFNLGFFVGIDKGIGAEANKWNFNNKLWYGFGIGYKLGVIGKKD